MVHYGKLIYVVKDGGKSKFYNWLDLLSKFSILNWVLLFVSQS